MSTMTNLSRDCVHSLKMFQEYIEMRYTGFDQVWMLDKIQNSIDCVRLVESILLEEGASNGEEFSN